MYSVSNPKIPPVYTRNKYLQYSPPPENTWLRPLSSVYFVFHIVSQVLKYRNIEVRYIVSNACYPSLGIPRVFCCDNARFCCNNARISAFGTRFYSGVPDRRKFERITRSIWYFMVSGVKYRNRLYVSRYLYFYWAWCSGIVLNYSSDSSLLQL